MRKLVGKGRAQHDALIEPRRRDLLDRVASAHRRGLVRNPLIFSACERALVKLAGPIAFATRRSAASPAHRSTRPRASRAKRPNFVTLERLRPDEVDEGLAFVRRR
jgi:hypothetical protein